MNADTSSEIDSFRSIWDLLINELPVKCASSGAKYPAAARPSLVILDVKSVSIFERRPMSNKMILMLDSSRVFKFRGSLQYDPLNRPLP